MNETPLSLLERLRSRTDELAWRRMVDLYTPWVRSWLGQFAVPASDADDIVQEVLGTLVRELPEFEHSGRRGAFRAFVRTIASNRLRTFWRNRGDGRDYARELASLADPQSAVWERWDREHDRFILRRLMELIEPEFSPSTWRSFRRVVLDGDKAATVASELGLTVNAVLIAKSRVLRRLREESVELVDEHAF
jgi:RNA polymerase sigma-70 factor (ECF subfamily)